MTAFFFIVRAIDSCILPGQLETCKKLINQYKEPEGKKLLFHKWEQKLNKFAD